MGNLYRFCEPIVLLTLARLGEAHGYQLASEADSRAVTHSGLDGAAVYRVLRRLEANGHVTSRWDTAGSGPARRLYSLTPSGHQHLAEWVQVMEDVRGALGALLSESRKAVANAASRSASGATRSA